MRRLQALLSGTKKKYGVNEKAGTSIFITKDKIWGCASRFIRVESQPSQNSFYIVFHYCSSYTTQGITDSNVAITASSWLVGCVERAKWYFGGQGVWLYSELLAELGTDLQKCDGGGVFWTMMCVPVQVLSVIATFFTWCEVLWEGYDTRVHSISIFRKEK